MIKLTKNTIYLFDIIMRHCFHYWIWTFCCLYMVLIHLPLDLLYNFNFLPDYFIHFLKVVSIKPVEAPIVVPNLNVVVENQELLSALNKIEQELVILNEGVAKLNNQLGENNLLAQTTINTVVETSKNFYNNSLLLNENVISMLQETNSLIKTDTNAQIQIAKRLIASLKDNNSLITSIDSSIININKDILNLDIHKGILSLTDILNQIVVNQKSLQAVYENNQDINLQSLNSILDMQHIGFNTVEDDLNKMFSKIHEIRNHNLDIYRQFDKNIDFKLENMESKIIEQVTNEINRPKTFSTEASKQNSWSSVFNNKK